MLRLICMMNGEYSEKVLPFGRQEPFPAVLLPSKKSFHFELSMINVPHINMMKAKFMALRMGSDCSCWAL